MKYVQSNYKAKWCGIVLNSVFKETAHPIYRGRPNQYLLTVLIVYDANGNKAKGKLRNRIKFSNEYWFDEVEPFDISHLPKEWLKMKDIVYRGR